MINSQRLLANERARCNCFRLLAACFYRPDKELFLREGLFENLSLQLGRCCPEASDFSYKMGRAILDYSNEDLLVAYAKLFVGPYELKAPPYGSVYLDGENVVMGDSTLGVIGMYEERGLSMAEGFGEMPDHITAELEFMYYLIFREVGALEAKEFGEAFDFIETQGTFLDRYLKKWVWPFCDKITEGAENGFYSALAGCLLSFILNARVPAYLDLHVPEMNAAR